MMKIRLIIYGAILAAGVLGAWLFPPVFAGRMLLTQGVVIGNLTLRWYGLILAFSVLIGYTVARKNSWRFGINKQEVDDLAFWLVLVAVLSARLYYVLSLWSFFSLHPQEIVKIWHGGLSVYGALIGGAGYLFFRSRKKIYSPALLFDLVALSLPLAQAFGRLGNFFNYEAFGLPTDLPWKMYVPPAFRPEQYKSFDFFHPAFLYELLWNLLVFLILWKLVGRVRRGVVALAYVMLYSLGRFFIEPLRLDASFVGSYHLDQLTAFAAVIIAMISILYLYSRKDTSQPAPRP